MSFLPSNPWWTFGAGVLAGIVGPRFLLGQPQGRKAVKTVIKGGLAVYDWVAAQVETLREDVADLAAEARMEQATPDGAAGARRDGKQPAPPAPSEGEPVASA